jgi:hypothetical protein
MNFGFSLAFFASIVSGAIGLVTLSKAKRSFPRWAFGMGMIILAFESLCSGIATDALLPGSVVFWETLAFFATALLPSVWLSFTLSYGRGNYAEFLKKWRFCLAGIFILPVCCCVFFPRQLLFAVAQSEGAWLFRVAPAGFVLNILLVIGWVLALMNLEATFRASVGTMRWRIKFVVVGLAVIFGARLYVRSQALLYSEYDTDWVGVESSALLIGCVFLVVAYVRTGFAEIDVYPSRVLLRSSLTVLIIGGYLFVVGVLANILRRFGGGESFQLAAFVVLLGMAGLAVLLLSDRLRQRIHRFVGLHFARAQHDSVRIWTEFSRRLAKVRDQAGLCSVSARLVPACSFSTRLSRPGSCSASSPPCSCC